MIVFYSAFFLFFSLFWAQCTDIYLYVLVLMYVMYMYGINAGAEHHIYY